MHATQHVQPLPEKAAARVKDAKAHTGLNQAAHKCVGQVGRAKAIHQHMHLDTALGCGQQGGMQFLPDLVLEQDEGFQHHLAPGLGNGVEHTREELLAVFQQLEVVARNPAG
ncbi:hypothetical protein D3C71_834070 [compost metagenome]